MTLLFRNHGHGHSLNLRDSPVPEPLLRDMIIEVSGGSPPNTGIAGAKGEGQAFNDSIGQTAAEWTVTPFTLNFGGIEERPEDIHDGSEAQQLLDG